MFGAGNMNNVKEEGTIMKIEHRLSFFIFQLSEKMNDPNVHAFFLILPKELN